MPEYVKMTEKQFKKSANEKKISVHDIMMWYKDASSTQERVDMVRLMKERIKVCTINNEVW